MKISHVSILIAGLFAGAAMAQPSTTTKMPDKDAAVTTPAGAAQGRAQTSVNMPQKGSDTKATPVPGSVAKEKQEKVVNSKAEQVQGSTSSAAKAGMEHPGAKSSHSKSTHGMNDSGMKKATPPEVLTTPAPGPANTTPTATSNSPTQPRK